VEIGNLDDQECGVGIRPFPSCDSMELECNTTYVFRAFVHGDSNKNRSAFSANVCCTTDPCAECTCKTQGFWETHAGDFPAANPLPDAWPDLTGCCTCTDPAGDGLCLGTVCYSKAQLLAILRTNAVKGNGLISLAHQLITAKLNVKNGCRADDSVLATIAAADTLIGSLVVPPSGSGSLPTSQTDALNHALDVFNNHCE